MKRWAVLAVALGAFGIASAAHANGGVSFIADRYYFEMSYGKVSLNPHQSAPAYEFYRETSLHGSGIWRLHFRSILRIEFPSESAALDSLSSVAERANIAWNRPHTHVLASFGEYAFILSPEFNLQAAFRNTSDPHWVSDDQIQAIVEVGGVSKYDTGIFHINVLTGRFRKVE